MRSFVPITPALDQRAPIYLRNELVALIDAIVSELNHPCVRARPLRLGQNLGIGVQSIAMNNGLRKADVIEPQLLQRILDAILRGQTEDQREVDTSKGQDRAPGHGLHLMRVEMSRRGIHHQVGDEDVLEPLDGLTAGMLVHRTDREMLEVVVRAGQLRKLLVVHAASPGLRRPMRLVRRKPTMRLPSLSKPSVRQVTIPFFGSLLDSRFSTVLLRATTVVPG